MRFFWTTGFSAFSLSAAADKNDLFACLGSHAAQADWARRLGLEDGQPPPLDYRDPFSIGGR